MPIEFLGHLLEYDEKLLSGQRFLSLGWLYSNTQKIETKHIPLYSIIENSGKIHFYFF
jgi:hypothetical protein